MEVKVKAPAKINLALDIKGKRGDGYHNVEMVMQSIDLYDIITIKEACHNDIEVNVNKDLKVDKKSNIAYKAAVAFFNHSKIQNKGIDIYIEKNIPIAAGLAGGSTDAAGVLVGLNKMFKTNYTNEELASIGAMIGADVPFCIFGGTMLATGMGTDLENLSPCPSCYFVLTKPNLSVSTKEAYALVDEVEFIDYKSVNSVIDTLNSADIDLLSKAVFNRFTQVIDFEEYEHIKRTAYESGALTSCMSGSGPTVFSIFKNLDHAKECINNLKKKYNEVFLCAPTKFGCQIIDN